MATGEVLGYLQLTSGKYAKSLALSLLPHAELKPALLQGHALVSEHEDFFQREWQRVALNLFFWRSISKWIITPPHARGSGLELQSGGSLQDLRPSSYGTVVRRGHLF